MTEITMAFVAPDTSRADDGRTAWFVQGGATTHGRAEALSRLVSDGDGASFCRDHGDATVVRLTDGAEPTVDIWKAQLSSRDVFWCVRANGDVIVADHFRNVMAALPVAERAPSDLTLAAHYLYRKPYPPLTITDGVFRVPGGRHVSIDLRRGDVETTQFDSVPSSIEARSDEEYLDLIESALVASMDDLDDATTAILFSGGVDSTLLLSLKPGGLQPVSFVPDTDEFQAEVGYAESAASMLGQDIERVEFAEATYLMGLEEAARDTGIAAFDGSTPYFHAALRASPHPTFVEGHGADSAFGPGLRLARVANWLRFAPTRTALTALAPRLPGHLGYRADQLASRSSGMARGPWDPDGWAGNGRLFGDPVVVGRITGDTHLSRLKDLQLDLVRTSIEGVGTNADPFLAHVEIRHWMTVLAGTTYDDLHSAMPYGKVVVGPFVDWRVQRALATIPIERRYVVGLRSKWILKDILKRHVPDYPVDQRKKATALPWKRFYTDGPLTGFFDHYPVPDHIPASMRDDIVTNPTTTTWSAISYAVWDEHVRRNTSLQPTATVASESRTIG